MENMPPKVTVDEMVHAVKEAEKPLTARDIANKIGVTRQTISNHRDDLESDARVEYGKVGNATAYWFAGDENQSDTGSNGGTLEDEDSPTNRTGKLAQVAGKWSLDLFGTALVGILLFQVAKLGGVLGLASSAAVEVVQAAILTIVLFGVLGGAFALLMALLASAWLWTPDPLIRSSKEHTRKRARQLGVEARGEEI